MTVLGMENVGDRETFVLTSTVDAQNDEEVFLRRAKRTALAENYDNRNDTVTAARADGLRGLPGRGWRKAPVHDFARPSLPPSPPPRANFQKSGITRWLTMLSFELPKNPK
jgi:hypothetical protein